jgi:isoleucyl-tRNA synthetase
MPKTLIWIRIGNGDVFEGTPAHFADAFFSNVSEETIRYWATKEMRDVKVELWYEGDQNLPPLYPQSNIAVVRTEEGRKKWYNGTLNLPKTDFPMMPKHPAERVAGERAVMKRWDGLYARLRRERQGQPQFVLHDGPPYANGDIHMGHAVNKVLKDMIVRYKSMRGFDAQFVPGWDCHGLPIEQAVQKENPGSNPFDRRRYSAGRVESTRDQVSNQAEQFKSLGVLADFDAPYLTTQPEYEAAVLRNLADLVENRMVYRAKKPVHWCIKHRTALAEAEIEYKDVTDTTATVMFEVDDSGASEGGISLEESDAARKPWKNLPREHHPLFLLVWTTTPWTLAANMAIAVNPNANYVCVWEKVGENVRRVIVAEDAAERVIKGENSLLSRAFKGSELVGTSYVTLDMRRRVIAADFVTTDTGTGLVHIAPGHGPVDFAVGKENGLEAYCPVDGGGMFTDYADLRGLGVWEANGYIIEQLRLGGRLYEEGKITHSYPHCWRCHQKVIFRATEQWFVSAGFGSLLNTAAILNARDVNWLPEWGETRFEGMMKTRPDWCISRQRLWGIPVPYFVRKGTGEVIMTGGFIRRVAEHFSKHGSNSWYTDSPAQIIGPGVTDLEKGEDILDVWFESGASWKAVMGEGSKWGMKYPADVYIEGSDQHRGWFQSSMLQAASAGDVSKCSSPARTIITHGFVLDKDGRKMSKELGNVIKVTDAVEKYGTDVVRLWVASVDYTDDVRCSDELFRNTTEAYRKIRNTFRYLLSNLYDFDGDMEGAVPDDDSLDNYMLWRLCEVRNAVTAAFDAYDFKTATKLVYDFLNIEVSSFYAKAIKDRLYCEFKGDVRRLRAQDTCFYILWVSLELIAPILPVMADEAWQHLLGLPCGKKLPPSVHLSMFGAGTDSEPYEGGWTELIGLVPDAVAQLDAMKKTAGLNNSLDAEVVLTIPQGGGWSKYGNDFEDAVGVGSHSFNYGDTLSVRVVDAREKYRRCERSRKRRPDVGENLRFPDLSKRDAGVVEGLMMADSFGI